MNKVRYYRCKNDLTQDELAKAVGTTKNYISDIEREVVKLSDNYKVKLAEYFGVSIEELEAETKTA